MDKNDFLEELGFLVQYAFDHCDELMERFYPSLNYDEFNEFYMSKSLCRLQVILKEGASVSLVIPTPGFLEWVERKNGEPLCEHGRGLTDYCQPCGRISGSW